MGDFDAYKREISSFFDFNLLILRQGIKCAVCNKNVQRFKVEQVLEADRLRCTVWCHGDMETVYLDHMTLVNATSVEPGIAFTTKRIDDGKTNQPAEPSGTSSGAAAPTQRRDRQLEGPSQEPPSDAEAEG